MTISKFRRIASAIGRAACALATVVILTACDGSDGGDGGGSTGDGSGSSSEASVADGRRVFARCQACHEVGAETNRAGPHLVGLFGRTAGSVGGYRYSAALAQSGLVWDEETLRAYLRDPRAAVPGNSMLFAGVRDDDDLDALIVYLRTATALD